MTRDFTIDVGVVGVTVSLPAWVAYTEHFVLYTGAVLLIGLRVAVAIRDWRRGR